MKTIRTTEYEHGAAGELLREIVTTEEIPDGKFLRIDGLSVDHVATLATIRDALLAKAAS